MAQQFVYRVTDILLKFTLIRPHFATHVFQVLYYMSALTHLICSTEIGQF